MSAKPLLAELKVEELSAKMLLAERQA